MAKTVLVDSGVLVGLVRRSDQFHPWSAAQAEQLPAPWFTCEAALSEAFFLAGPVARPVLSELLRRGHVASTFSFAAESEVVLRLMAKYADVPMSFADACLLRLTETLPDPLLLTTDTDFRLYRRHGRLLVPCRMP